MQECTRLSPALKKFTIQLEEGLSYLSSWFVKDEKSRYIYRWDKGKGVVAEIDSRDRGSGTVQSGRDRGKARP